MPATETVENEGKLCLDCGKPLGPGKLGKKYCDEYCKSNYHNRVNREKRSEAVPELPVVPVSEPAPTVTPVLLAPDQTEHVHNRYRNIHAALAKNWDIMNEICDEDHPCHIKLRTLLGRGFNLKYFTSQTDPTPQGHVYRFCYEYGYRLESEDSVIVICRPREIYF